jgi:hypothetical protein
MVKFIFANIINTKVHVSTKIFNLIGFPIMQRKGFTGFKFALFVFVFCIKQGSHH